jgi:hypothetical protein
MHICAEIMYDGENGSVHSDICMIQDGPAYREFLHANLDEWLDKSNGTGLFYIGDPALATEQPDDPDIPWYCADCGAETDPAIHDCPSPVYTLADQYGDSPYFDPDKTWEGMDSRYPTPEL